MSFTTVTEVCRYVNMPSTSMTSFELSQIGAVIVYVDGIINNYCGWILLSTDYVNSRFDGTGLAELDLRVYPVNSISSCRIRSTDGSFIDITSDMEIYDGGVIGFKPNPTSGATVFTLGKRNIFVSFNAGFDDIPSDLAFVATHLTALNFKKIKEESFDVESAGVDQETVKYSSIEIPQLMLRSLDRYRLLSVF